MVMAFDMENLFSPNKSDSEYDIPKWDTAYEVILTIAAIVGMISDILIITSVYRNKNMKNKTNSLISQMATNDFLYIISVLVIFRIINAAHDMSGNRIFGCVSNHIETMFQFSSTLIVQVLITSSLIKNDDMTTNKIFAAIYIVTIIMVVASLALCPSGYEFFFIVMSCALLYSFVVLAIKEIVHLCRKNPLSLASKFRFNVARIFIYNWMVLWILIITLDNVYSVFYQIVFISVIISSAYILLYLVCTDENWKNCVMNNFRSNKVPIQPENDSSKAEEGKN